MGYSIIIGEAKIESYAEDGLEAQCRITAEGASDAAAPAFGEPTDNTNSRWPSYGSWHDFCEQAGITDAIFEGGTLRGGHPGAFPINQEFKDVIDGAYHRLRMQAKTLDPDADIFSTEVGGAWARIQWLKYWTDWALDNCKVPVMANS